MHAMVYQYGGHSLSLAKLETTCKTYKLNGLGMLLLLICICSHFEHEWDLFETLEEILTMQPVTDTDRYDDFLQKCGFFWW